MKLSWDGMMADEPFQEQIAGTAEMGSTQVTAGMIAEINSRRHSSGIAELRSTQVTAGMY